MAAVFLAETCDASDLRVIAFYLPQFHRIAENDRWWGEGFTEWTNVRKARPVFLGHYQPHVPVELGYYDLTDAKARAAQAALAREYGIHGFCYYHYWFNGKRLLERPLEQVLASGEPDFPYCVCWANENWTRRWDGLEHEILLKQAYGLDDSRALFESLLPLFRDRRYIRIDGRPLLLVYKAALIPDLANTTAMWREQARAAGWPDVYLAACQTVGEADPVQLGFDAGVEFPPHRHNVAWRLGAVEITNPNFSGIVTSYKSQVVQSLELDEPAFKLFRTAIPGWDNTPRRPDTGTIFVGSSPELFEYWIERLATWTRERFAGDERVMFVNAWNEWGEGCHLEPDARFGRQYLEALRRGIAISVANSGDENRAGIKTSASAPSSR